MQEAGAKVQNLLTKGSLNHLTYQLKQTAEVHFEHIKDSIALAQKNGIATNVYLEDWSNGMRNSPDYVYSFLDFLNTQPIKRVLLPDTLGVLTPTETFKYLSEIISSLGKLAFPTISWPKVSMNVFTLSKLVISFPLCFIIFK